MESWRFVSKKKAMLRSPPKHRGEGPGISADTIARQWLDIGHRVGDGGRGAARSLALAFYADKIGARLTAMGVLLLAASALTVQALLREPTVLIGASIAFGLTVGNVTTLAPIIVRREFGAASLGAVYGAASCGIQLITALGPGFYGV